MFDSSDPRSSLATGTTAPSHDAVGAGVAAAAYHDFDALAGEHGSDTVVVRAQNVVVVHSRVRAGDQLDTGALSSESAVICTQDSPVFDLLTEGVATRVDEPALVVVAPGASQLVAHGAGTVVRLIEAGEQSWARRAVNSADYTEDHPRVAPLQPWPRPVDDCRVRVYPLSQVPDHPTRFGRIFRTRSFMVNFLPPHQGPRDRRKLSPHTHDDFEQLSLAVSGSYVHHIRTPWLPDSTTWRQDEHVRMGSPSVAIIPPPTVHTSEAVGSGENSLIDIFSPPRADFSAKPGWVLNADDYPMP